MIPVLTLEAAPQMFRNCLRIVSHPLSSSLPTSIIPDHKVAPKTATHTHTHAHREEKKSIGFFEFQRNLHDNGKSKGERGESEGMGEEKKEERRRPAENTWRILERFREKRLGPEESFRAFAKRHRRGCAVTTSSSLSSPFTFPPSRGDFMIDFIRDAVPSSSFSSLSLSLCLFHRLLRLPLLGCSSFYFLLSSFLFFFFLVSLPDLFQTGDSRTSDPYFSRCRGDSPGPLCPDGKYNVPSSAGRYPRGIFYRRV